MGNAPRDDAQALELHDDIVGQAVTNAGGVVLKARGEGDSTFSVFRRATDAVSAALTVHEALANAEWPTGCRIGIRMAMHSGEAIERDGDYYGRTVNRVARLRGVAESGQILLSETTANLIGDDLPSCGRLVDLGLRELRDLDRPEHVHLLAPEEDSTPAVEVAGAAPAESVTIPLPARLDYPTTNGFVGRTEHLEQLHSMLKEAEHGRLRVALLSGEAGIGKSASQSSCREAATRVA